MSSKIPLKQNLQRFKSLLTEECVLETSYSDYTSRYELPISIKADLNKNISKSENDIKIVIVGDGAVGKTCLMIRYLEGIFPQEYVPTVYKNGDQQITKVKINSQSFNVQIIDTAGQEDYDRLRPLSYPNTDIFIACFSVICKSSFENVLEMWLPEIFHHCPNIPFICVGLKSDLRFYTKSNLKLFNEYQNYGFNLILNNYLRNNKLNNFPNDLIYIILKYCKFKIEILEYHKNLKFVDRNYAQKEVKSERAEYYRIASDYLECSAINGKGVQNVFLKAIQIVINERQMSKKKKCKIM